MDESARERERQRLASLQLHEDGSGINDMEFSASPLSRSFNSTTTMEKSAREREQERLASLQLHEDGVKPDFPHETIEEASLAFQQPVQEAIEEQVWEIDRTALVIENKLGNDLFAGKYRKTDVCIKFLKNLEVQKLRDFVETSKLSHRNVIKVIGICTEPLNHFVVFESVARTLYDVLHTDTTILDNRTLAQVAYDVASGMQHLHEKRIIHGDLISSYLLMTNDKVVKISGYGVLGGEKLCGSFSSMNDDVFSYGILLWELITKEVPMTFIFEMSRKNSHQITSHETSFRSIIEGFLEYFRQRIPKEANSKLIHTMERCWSAEPPTFEEITKLLRQPSTAKTGFFHYR